jgi:hypothetical protein
MGLGLIGHVSETIGNVRAIEAPDEGKWNSLFAECVCDRIGSFGCNGRSVVATRFIG